MVAGRRPAAGGEGLGFNSGVRVPTLAFDRVTSRDQRRRAGHAAGSSPLDVFYDVDHSVTETRPRGQRFSPPPRKAAQAAAPLDQNLKGTRMGMLNRGALDVSYNVQWSTQERRLKGSVRIGRGTLASPDHLYPFRRPASSAPRMTGVLGDAHPDPAARHCPAPSIGRQTDRRQQGKVGFTDKDPRQDAWNSQHGPLNVKYTATEPRPGRFAPFGRQSSRSPDGPFSALSVSGDCYTDAEEPDDALSETERVDIHRSFAVVRRPVGRRVVGMATSYSAAAYAHAQRPASRLGCGHYREEQSTAMYPTDKRVDADGRARTKEQFHDRYGGLSEWDRASPAVTAAAHPRRGAAAVGLRARGDGALGDSARVSPESPPNIDF